MFKKTLALMSVIGLLFVSTGASAGTWEHTREGFLIGFSAGAGGAALELAPTSGGTITSEREGGGAGNFRVGYAVKPSLALAFESNAWGKSENATILGTEFDFSYRVQVAAFAATWYPNAGGLFLRGGLGIGTGKIEVKNQGASTEIKDSGFGFLAAAGYEWRLTQKFALGPQVDFGYMSLGEVDATDDAGDPVRADYSVNYVNVSLGFNWYW